MTYNFKKLKELYDNLEDGKELAIKVNKKDLFNFIHQLDKTLGTNFTKQDFINKTHIIAYNKNTKRHSYWSGKTYEEIEKEYSGAGSEYYIFFNYEDYENNEISIYNENTGWIF